MKQLCTCFCILLLFAFGCGRQSENISTVDPPSGDPPAVPNTDTSNDTSPSSDEPLSTSEPPKPTQPITRPVDPALREQVAKLAIQSDGQLSIDQAAKQFLEDRGPDALQDIAVLMSDKSPDVRRGAAFFLLERFDPDDPKMFDAFLRTLSDDDSTIRSFGVTALKRMPVDVAAGASEQLATLLRRKDESATNRSEIARLLGKMESRAVAALPALIQTAREDPNVSVRKVCLNSVERIGSPSDVVPLLQDMLKSKSDPTTRIFAAAKLKRLGTESARAAQDLAGALGDINKDVRMTARDALIAIGEPSVKPLIAQLESKNPRTRGLAVFALGKLGSVAKPALPSLERLLEDQNEEVRALTPVVIRAIQASQ